MALRPALRNPDANPHEKEGLIRSPCGIVSYSPNAWRRIFRKKSPKKEIVVAGFCSKCGAPLAPNAQFCPACGTPSATVPVAAPFVAVPPPVAQQPIAPQSYALPPAAPPQQGSSALKIVLIIVAVIFGLGILAAGAFGFFVWRVAHSIHVSGNGSDVTINTPGGHISTGNSENFSSSDLGTDVYPGAQPGKGSMRMSLPTGSMVSAVYITSDSKDQVLAFYKSKFPDNVSTFDTVSGSVVTYNNTDHESVVVTITSNPSENDGKTQIHILHTTKSS
jgi:hypothetical protein